MKTLFNTHSMSTLTYGRVSLADFVAFSASPQISGGAALNVTWLSDTPMVVSGGGFMVVPLGLRFLLSGTWAACTLTVKSMSKGDEAISIAMGTTGEKLTSKTFLRSDIQSIITNIDPGSTAKLDIEYVYANGAKPCASGAAMAALAGVVGTKPGISPRTWGKVGASGDNIAIELSSATGVVFNTQLYLEADGRARKKETTDTTGVVLGSVKGPLLSIGGKTYAPFDWSPRDL